MNSHTETIRREGENKQIWVIKVCSEHLSSVTFSIWGSHKSIRFPHRLWPKCLKIEPKEKLPVSKVHFKRFQHKCSKHAVRLTLLSDSFPRKWCEPKPSSASLRLLTRLRLSYHAASPPTLLLSGMANGCREQLWDGGGDIDGQPEEFDSGPRSCLERPACSHDRRLCLCALCCKAPYRWTWQQFRPRLRSAALRGCFKHVLPPAAALFTRACWCFLELARQRSMWKDFFFFSLCKRLLAANCDS